MLARVCDACDEVIKDSVKYLHLKTENESLNPQQWDVCIKCFKRGLSVDYSCEATGAFALIMERGDVCSVEEKR